MGVAFYADRVLRRLFVAGWATAHVRSQDRVTTEHRDTASCALPAGAIAYLYYADRVYQLPLGVIGIAIGTALLPHLSRQLKAGEEAAAVASLNRAIEAALLRKNYESLSLGPAPKADTGSSFPPDVAKVHDAELSCRIVFWSADSGSRPEMELRFRVEIYSAAEREKLYVGTFKAVMRDTARTRTAPRLDTVIRPAVIRALSDLPPAGVSSP